MKCRRCGSELINGKCPNCTRDIANDNILENNNNKRKRIGFIKLLIIFIVLIIIGILGFYFYNKYENNKHIESLNLKRNEIIEILNKPSSFTNGDEILEEIPIKEEEIVIPKIDLSYSQEKIELDDDEKEKSLFVISNKILNESVEVNAELFLTEDKGLILKGTIENITNGFNFPKLTLRVLSYNTNLDNKPLLQHNKYYLIEDLYTFDIKEGEIKEFTMKIRDKNTKYIKLGLKTGNLFLHSEENAVSVNNDITIPVITTDKYNPDEDSLPFRFAIINENGEVSKIYEHKNLIKEYKSE